MFRVSFFAVVVLAAACPSRAEPSSAARQACEADYRRLCAAVLPGGGRILKCLHQHDGDLTPGCRSALESSRTDAK